MRAQSLLETRLFVQSPRWEKGARGGEPAQKAKAPAEAGAFAVLRPDYFTFTLPPPRVNK